MSLRTIKNKEIIIPGIEGYGFHRHQNLTKAILAKLLEYFFSTKTKTFKKIFNDLDKYQADKDKPDLYILQAFPYAEKKVPCIIVTIAESDELPYCLGADNTIALSKQGESSFIELFSSGAKLPISLGILSESPDTTADIASLVQSCFATVFKWQYIFVGDDLSSFSICPAITKIKISNNFEEPDTENKIVYGTVVSFTSQTQSVFTDNSNVSKYTLVQNFGLDPKSGPTSV